MSPAGATRSMSSSSPTSSVSVTQAPPSSSSSTHARSSQANHHHHQHSVAQGGVGVMRRGGFCARCVSLAKWIPVVFITGIVGWSYYAYVVHLCILTVDSHYERVVLLLLYHVFFVLFVWSYWQTVFTLPGRVPRRFALTDTEMDDIESSDHQRRTLDQLLIGKDLPCTMRSIQGEVRFCSECSLIKPDRAHHCGVCGQCVLKMDHHCPWVNNCVAFMNYKFFILFLGYALIYCIYVALSSLKYFLEFWSTTAAGQMSGKFHVLFLFFVSAMFSISLASLFGYHCYLVSKNMTTLEAFRTPVFRNGPDKLAFHLGKLNNFQEVFGDNKWTWFLPVFSSFGDGIVFPQRNQSDEEAGLLVGSPPQTEYPSEEHMPMMLQSGRSHAMSPDTAWNDRWNESRGVHVMTSSSTESSGESMPDKSSLSPIRGYAQANGQANGSSSGPVATQDLISVNPTQDFVSLDM